MKTLVRTLLIVAATTTLGYASEQLLSVPFVLGPTNLKVGDAIIIRDVRATSTNLTVGDRVVVRGRYDLKSQPTASLCLYLTTRDESHEHELPTQTAKIEKGSSDFELSTVVKSVGYLHLSLYGEGKKDFACVYFGTPSQMSAIRNWDISR